jgi:hypothetical protein
MSKEFTIHFKEDGSVWEGQEHAHTLLGAKRIARRLKSANEKAWITKRFDTEIIADLSYNNGTKWVNY